MLHPEFNRDPLPQPDGTAQLNIYPFREQQRYVSFYPYYVPSGYTDYYPKKFGRYYQPITVEKAAIVSVSNKKPVLRLTTIALIVLLIILGYMFVKK
jgi:hypothetical protein